MEEDWQVMMAYRILEIMQENTTGFIPLIVPFIQEPADEMMVP